MFSKIFWPLLRLAVFAALVRGVFLWLKESRDIDVERWVATLIGAVESMAVEAPSWAGWVLAGGAGLLFTTIWEITKYRSWFPWQREEHKPERLQDKQDQVREGLRGGGSDRRLRMTVGETRPYFDIEGGVYNIKRTFNLKLENTDRNKSVSNCSVQILSVTPPADYEGPWRIMEGLGLAAGDHVFIPLVTYGEAREPDKGTRGDTFITMGTENGRPYLDVGEKYTVALRATALETSYCEFQCKVWVDENGRLRIEGD